MSAIRYIYEQYCYGDIICVLKNYTYYTYCVGSLVAPLPPKKFAVLILILILINFFLEYCTLRTKNFTSYKLHNRYNVSSQYESTMMPSLRKSYGNVNDARNDRVSLKYIWIHSYLFKLNLKKNINMFLIFWKLTNRAALLQVKNVDAVFFISFEVSNTGASSCQL